MPVGPGGISLNIFSVLFLKILIPNDLRARVYGGPGQNIEPQGLAAKISANKDLVADLGPPRRSAMENLLGELLRIG